MTSLDNFIESALQGISPKLAQMYVQNLIFRTVVLGWIFVVIQFVFVIFVGQSVVGWMLSGFIAFVIIKFGVGDSTKPSASQEVVADIPAPLPKKRFRSKPVQTVTPISSPVPQEQITVPCTRCKGTKYVMKGEVPFYCGLCKGKGYLTPQPMKGSLLAGIPGLPQKGSGQKLPPQMLMGLYIVIGMVMISIGSRIGGITQTAFVLGGVGAILVGVWMFGSKKKQSSPTVASPYLTPKSG